MFEKQKIKKFLKPTKIKLAITVFFLLGPISIYLAITIDTPFFYGILAPFFSFPFIIFSIPIMLIINLSTDLLIGILTNNIISIINIILFSIIGIVYYYFISCLVIFIVKFFFKNKKGRKNETPSKVL